jgi:hypothetical protein
MMMRSIKRGVLATALAAALLALPAAGQAQAAEPWWHLVTISAPAAPDSSEAKIDLFADNLGDAPTSGTYSENEATFLAGETKNLITVVDKLPPGVTAVHALGEGGGAHVGQYGDLDFQEDVIEALEIFGFKPPQLCSTSGQALTGQTVECKYMTPVHPYEQMIIQISVKVAPGAGSGRNEVTVSGGGAAAVSSRQALAVEAPVPAYGVQTYEITPEEEGGIPATQAGSHPFQLTTTLFFNTEAAHIVDCKVEKTCQEPHRADEGDPELKPLAFT